MMSESETKNPLEARVAELERRLELLDEIVFEAISELGKIGAPLERSHLMLMRIFCKIDGVPEESLDRDPDAEALKAAPPSAAPRFRVITGDAKEWEQ